ncbi:ADL1, partial [Symbiodinium pilosum]
DAVALAALVVGTILAVRGRAVIKFLFVFCFSLSITLWTCLAAKKDGHTGLGMVVASLVLPCAVMAADRLYLLFCFLVGGAVGGTLGYAFRGLISLPALAVGLLVVASLVSGLVFLRWRNLGWRLLLPPLGALLLGASLRYCFARVLLDGEAHWLDFAYAPWSDLQALASDALDVCFICASGVFTLLGWYLQFASLLGLDDPLALPEHIENLLEKTQEWLPVVFDGSMESAKPHAPAEVTEPFLGRKAERDTKPEVILFIAILTVLLLCGLLCSRPLLFLGHVVLMSCAFTPLMTAGLLSYSSRSSRQALHEHSGAVSLGLALLCALGGYACMYVENKLNETSHLGLSDDGDVAERTIRVLHVWLGYAILGILCILALIAPGMLRAGERSRSRSIATCQRVLGKMMYGLGMTTQILGYFIEGLLPSWASWLLTSSLLAVALATLAASEGPYSVRVSEEVSGSRDGYSPPAPAPAAVLGPTRAAPARAPEKQAPPVIPCVSIASTKI